MTSFLIGISPSRRAAGRFVSRVRRALQRAVAEEGERNGLNQSKIADAIGVHRSVISRELNGRQDITLGRIAELAWAMGREIEFDLIRPEVDAIANIPATASTIVVHNQERAFKSRALALVVTRTSTSISQTMEMVV